MRVVSDPGADEEVEAAAFWYEDRQLRLGDDFLEEYQVTLGRIQSEKFETATAKSISIVFPMQSFTGCAQMQFIS
jgi:hypothetical protein